MVLGQNTEEKMHANASAIGADADGGQKTILSRTQFENHIVVLQHEVTTIAGHFEYLIKVCT